jgi:hypothetical protein
MASIKEDIKNLLNKLDYQVIVSKIDYGCSVYYPWAGVNTYLVASDGFVLCDENNKNFIYYLPPYAIRIGIITQIDSKCKINGYNLKMIHYCSGDSSVKNIYKILDSPKDPKERKLFGIFKTGIKFDFAKFVEDIANENGVLEPYLALIKIWENQ